jgi:hypothetical protein
MDKYRKNLIDDHVEAASKRLVLEIEDNLNHYINEELMDFMEKHSTSAEDEGASDLWNDMFMQIYDTIIIELNHRR